MAEDTARLTEFLKPLDIDLEKVVQLAKKLEGCYRGLARESHNQFLPTPISDRVLRPNSNAGGRYLATDIGGTNLRVGFVELSAGNVGHEATSLPRPNGSVNGFLTRDFDEDSRVSRTLEKSWPIGEQLKNEKAEDLFSWIGERMAEVVADGLKTFDGGLPDELPLGVTFSFPMIQRTLSDATLMSMGKGFTITSNLDLGDQLRQGYARAIAGRGLPNVKIMAIVNDAVATFVSFVYQLNADPRRKAAMGLIVGTGNNATIPLRLSSLHPDKIQLLSNSIQTASTQSYEERMVINTEWSINGTAPPLNDLGLVTRWDEVLDTQGEAPGFMPFEQMSAGRYLGEIGRIMIFEYFTEILKVAEVDLPKQIRQRHGITTAFLGRLGHGLDGYHSDMVIEELDLELPCPDEGDFEWSAHTAEAVYQIGKAIQMRAAGMTAAAIIGLLACADELSLSSPIPLKSGDEDSPDCLVEELIVGYTGGCIVHFHDYLQDCQTYLDEVMESLSDGMRYPKVVLQSCHDGGIIGAGVLAGSVQSLSSKA